MELREPAEVLDKVVNGELATEIVNRQVTLFVPNLMALQTKTRMGWIMRMAKSIYGPSVIKEAGVEIRNRDHSVSFRLPPMFERYGVDYRLELLQRLIRMAYVTSEADAEEEFIAPKGAPKPAEAIDPGGLLEEDSEEDFPFVRESEFSTKFYPDKTEFFIPARCVGELGRTGVIKLVEIVYSRRTLERVYMPRWSGNNLILPPTAPIISRFTDPRIELLKKRIMAACNRR